MSSTRAECVLGGLAASSRWGLLLSACAMNSPPQLPKAAILAVLAGRGPAALPIGTRPCRVNSSRIILEGNCKQLGSCKSERAIPGVHSRRAYADGEPKLSIRQATESPALLFVGCSCAPGCVGRLHWMQFLDFAVFSPASAAAASSPAAEHHRPVLRRR